MVSDGTNNTKTSSCQNRNAIPETQKVVCKSVDLRKKKSQPGIPKAQRSTAPPLLLPFLLSPLLSRAISGKSSKTTKPELPRGKERVEREQEQTLFKDLRRLSLKMFLEYLKLE